MPQDFDRPLALSVAIDDRGSTRIVTARGEIDAGSAGLIARALRGAMSDRRFELVVLDLGETTFIDTAGMAVVIDASQRAAERALGFVVIRGPAVVQRVFDAYGFSELVPFVSDWAAA